MKVLYLNVVGLSLQGLKRLSNLFYYLIRRVTAGFNNETLTPTAVTAPAIYEYVV